MFNCLWLRAPRDLPLPPRLYQRTYGRTYGRRPSPVDQPVAMPDSLRVSGTVTVVPASSVQPAAGHSLDTAIAGTVHRAA